MTDTKTDPTLLLSKVANPEAAALLVEPDAATPEQARYAREVEEVLSITEKEISGIKGFAENPESLRSWGMAKKVVEEFQPVPWFIWRLSNYVLGNHSAINTINDGMVLGLRRLLFAAASDRVLGTGDKINNVRKALEILPSDVVAAVSVIHAICRRLHTKQFERIWRPVLEDAILRAHLGYFVGQMNQEFGAGRGMLAGFAGRCGLAILISAGELSQAQKALELLASGMDIKDVGYEIYSCDPLHVSAMTLSASGCGRGAAFGTVSYSAPEALRGVLNQEHKHWLAAFTISDHVRVGKLDEIEAEHWQALRFVTKQDQDDLKDLVKISIRKGHGWNWLIGS